MAKPESDFVTRCAQSLSRDGTVSVATAGAIAAYPGNTSVIAGSSTVSFDVRSMDDSRCHAAIDRLGLEVQAIADLTSTTVALSLSSLL